MDSPRIRLSSATRQAEIVDAVVRLAARRSPALITTGDIAKALALTQGALFRHFPNKQAIWLAVIDWAETQLLAALEAAAGAAASPREKLRAMFMAHVRFVIDNPGVPRFIFNELQQPDDTPVKQRVRALLARYRALLAHLLGEAEARGQLAAGIDQAAAATLFIGTVQGLVMQSMLAGGGAALAAEAERVFALYLRAIGEAT